MVLTICFIGWIMIGGIVAFGSIFAHERPPLCVDAVAWIFGALFMFLINTYGG